VSDNPLSWQCPRLCEVPPELDKVRFPRWRMPQALVPCIRCWTASLSKCGLRVMRLPIRLFPFPYNDFLEYHTECTLVDFG